VSWAEQRGGIDYVATRKEQKKEQAAQKEARAANPVDPTENVTTQLALARHILDCEGGVGAGIDTADATELAELVIAFVEWRQKGGADANWPAVPTDGLDE
jgi:hypothetical protein